MSHTNAIPAICGAFLADLKGDSYSIFKRIGWTYTLLLGTSQKLRKLLSFSYGALTAQWPFDIDMT